MIQRLEGHVEKVKFIKKISDGLDQMEIQIDFDTLTIFYDAAELTKFEGQDVVYSVRQDVVGGIVKQVICEIALVQTIQTVSSIENVKLIPEGTQRTICNLDSRLIRYGDIYPGVVALMSRWVLGTSAKSRWYDCTLIDMSSREFSVRLFKSDAGSPEADEIMNSYIGHYAQFTLKSTQFGYQTNEFNPLPNPVEQSPEVVVAKEIIEATIRSDEGLMEYAEKHDFINNMLNVIDGEPGYMLVRIASELYMINAIDNISTDLDIKTMKRAAITSRGYLLPSKREYSRPLANVNKILVCARLKGDEELMYILDALTDKDASNTKLTYIKVRGLVDDIIKIRRGVKNEKDIESYAAVSGLFNGLC